MSGRGKNPDIVNLGLLKKIIFNFKFLLKNEDKKEVMED